MLALMLLTWIQPAHAGRPYAGLEFDPLSRQDLVAVDEARTSGTAVGELDGTVRSVASAYGGAWLSRYVGLHGGLGIALAQQRSSVDDVSREQTFAVVRPSVDMRLGWMERRTQFPIPWVLVGLYGDIPIASDTSNGFTAEEQQAADKAADNDRFRLGAIGARMGAGIDYAVLPGLAIGAQVTVGLHASTFLGGDQGFTSLWIATEASILLEFQWPPTEGRRSRRESSEKQAVQPEDAESASDDGPRSDEP